MLWFVLGLFTAFFDSLKYVFSKKALQNTDKYIVVLSLSLFSLPFLLPLILYTGLPEIGEDFWWALITLVTLNIITSNLYIKAIQVSDLSITIPMLGFTPLFLLFTSPFIVGEIPSVIGIIGVLLIVLGTYELNIKKLNQGYLSPFKALLQEQGPKLMLLVAFIWSFSSNIDKIGVQNSSPIFWVFSTRLLIAPIMLSIVFYKARENVQQIYKNYKQLLPIGLCITLLLIFQNIALTMTLVPYVIAIKRTSIVISVIFGYLFFKEKNIKERLIGAIIIFIGILFIIILNGV